MSYEGGELSRWGFPHLDNSGGNMSERKCTGWNVLQIASFLTEWRENWAASTTGIDSWKQSLWLFSCQLTSHYYVSSVYYSINPLTGTLKPQSNGPLYSTDTLAVDCYIWYGEEGPGQAAAPPRPFLAVPNIRAHQSAASVPTSYYSM